MFDGNINRFDSFDSNEQAASKFAETIDYTTVQDSVITFVGRRYCLRLVNLTDYSKHQKQRSKRWDTLTLPGDIFKRVSRPLEKAWPTGSSSTAERTTPARSH